MRPPPSSRGFTTRRRTRFVLGVAALLVAALLFDGWRLLRKNRWNASIAAGAADAPADAPPQVLFAQAHALAASGPGDAALDRYRALQADSALGRLARYNSANLLLRQAVELRAGPQPGQAIPLIELAKETYREVLRQDPDQWDARYNLERAQRLLPDPDDGDGDPPAVPRNAERAATTMRGFSPGLP